MDMLVGTSSYNIRSYQAMVSYEAMGSTQIVYHAFTFSLTENVSMNMKILFNVAMKMKMFWKRMSVM